MRLKVPSRLDETFRELRVFEGNRKLFDVPLLKEEFAVVDSSPSSRRAEKTY